MQGRATVASSASELPPARRGPRPPAGADRRSAQAARTVRSSGGDSFGFAPGWAPVFALAVLAVRRRRRRVRRGHVEPRRPPRRRRRGARDAQAPGRGHRLAESDDRTTLPAIEGPVRFERTLAGDACRRHRERHHARCRRRAANAARVLPPRTPRSDRHQRRLRHLVVRHLHGARRRRGREVVHDARRAGRRSVGHDDRGHGRRRRHDAPAAGCVPSQPRAAVRVLHARHDHGRGELPAGEPEPHGRRGARVARGEPLPVHRLPEHRGVDPRRRRSRWRRRARGRPWRPSSSTSASLSCARKTRSCWRARAVSSTTSRWRAWSGSRSCARPTSTRRSKG